VCYCYKGRNCYVWYLALFCLLSTGPSVRNVFGQRDIFTCIIYSCSNWIFIDQYQYIGDYGNYYKSKESVYQTERLEHARILVILAK
jgi:hypothetical protein